MSGPMNFNCDYGHVSSASAQLLQMTDGHVNHSRYQNTPGLYNRPMFNLSKTLFFYI